MIEGDTEAIRILSVGVREVCERAATVLDGDGRSVSVIAASTGEEALAVLAELEIDCVVSAYHLPESDGLSLLRRVREEYPALPFVLFTDEGSERIASTAISAGVTEYLQRHSDTGASEVLARRIYNAVVRQRTERALRRSEQRYRALVENSPIPIGIYTDDPEIVYANTAAVDFFNATEAGNLCGRSPLELIHEEDRQQSLERMRGVLDDRIPSPAREVRFVATDGEQKVAVVSSAPITLGSRTAAQVVLNDITEYKRTVAALEAEQRSTERQNERLEQFAGVVSHDLRSPLNVARGFLEQYRIADEPDHLDKIEDALLRMETIVEELLELATQGQTVRDPSPVESRQVVTNAWSTVETTDATLEAGWNRTIEADPKRLRRLFENLFRNCIEHASTDVQRSESASETNTIADGTADTGQEETVEFETGVTVRVGVLEDGFFVADDGDGIPESERDDIFTSGYTTADSGSGFGLAIVNEIAAAHGWSITATESASGGARFEITGVDVIA